ncbi:hypothetical protein NEHOM01_1976 [Nematocida homosporus]|uniref:uncharacterized protein n=1 Tax=Nematocida homosporus TaxID=1912981 RepID=UPI0022203435|nr:uncharacterized protein NEHOM01_1976 [Nematocida homosporus]KAI5187167.1 hypothetical protein NEHOM01_1976 [Nematocida homosporus]
MDYRHYVIVRNDLTKYSTGALIAQGIHSTLYAFSTLTTPASLSYLKHPEQMTTIVLQCTLAQIQELAKQLEEQKVPHRLWIEQPENEPTSLSLLPISPSDPICRLLKKYPLYK